MNLAFATHDLIKRYGATTALDGVTLQVGEGELLGLLGPNGAGKSTLVKIGCGLVRATSGSAEVCGAPAGSFEARAAIGYLAELFRFPPWLEAGEVLALHQELAGSKGGPDERAELLALVGLGDVGGRRVDAMSKGMQQRLGIAQALIGSPRLLVLDEPTSALDPAGRRAVRVILEEVKQRGISVILSSHLLSEVELVCDRVVIISNGSIVAEGAPADMVAQRGVEIETDTGTASFPGAERHQVPELVAKLVASGRSIYSVRARKPSLEDVYIETVGEQVR
jgi:ABC-2 type transport system ATP-binding protein